MDLRLPIGAFFLAVGVILCLAGLVLPSSAAPLADPQVNLYVGIALLAFGGLFMLLARRQR
jgi:hypothetical protein